MMLYGVDQLTLDERWWGMRYVGNTGPDSWDHHSQLAKYETRINDESEGCLQ